jgi:hydrogenase maturation protein HypF
MDPLVERTVQAPSREANRRLRTVICGAVQGVGFRPFVYRLAAEMGLTGWVINSTQGVCIEVDGAEPVLREFLLRVEKERPAISYIQSIESSFLDAAGFTRFEIRESAGGEKTALILPDLATCPECLRDIGDPRNRRYRYPFTNCTNCGPRFTIIESLPYDRPRTAMKKFTMCQECAREYHDPNDRRFHAQPNACPACGPQLELWNASGEVVAERAVALLAAAEAIRRGEIVAVKGLGGFHLMVDARNQEAVLRLRQRKAREEKPFALMYPSAAMVLAHCRISAVEDRLLRSVASPIVLLQRTAQAGELAPAIAPRNPWLGVMLPYTPLHHLLMAGLQFPVVATSGNLADEPICTDEREALRRLHEVADRLLVHNRPILRHVDDSIVREMGGRELVLRRARGFAPLPISLEREMPCLLAVGAHQKNSVAASVGKQVFISQHIGDLETTQAFQAFQDVIASLGSLYDLKPQAVACDLHPRYLSTQYAQSRGMRTIPLQHHYAHVLSCMAENDLRAPVLGVAWDGSGYGPDGTVWGGEFLRVTGKGFSRVAHLRTFRLPGGDKAVKEPRRAALAILYEIFGAGVSALADAAPLRAFSGEELRVLQTMLQCGLNAPFTSSAGRLFDAVASLTGLRQVCRFEGQSAIELEFDITGTSEESYAFELHQKDAVIVVDWEPMIRQILAEEIRSNIAQKFHNTLVQMMVAVARRAGEPKVVLTGGCFQNKYLTESAVRHLSDSGFQPYFHQRVPPHDGGISLGQIIGAASQLLQE